jgi:hypothetical protein
LRATNTVYIDAADSFDLRSSDRLPVSNDRQGFEGGPSHARRATAEKFFHPIGVDFRRPQLVTAGNLNEANAAPVVFQLRLDLVQSGPNVFLLNAFQHFAQPLNGHGSIGDEQ